jgi:hypothetical protein
MDVRKYSYAANACVRDGQKGENTIGKIILKELCKSGMPLLRSYAFNIGSRMPI